MIFRQLFDRESSTYTYLLADEEQKVAALIDPVREHVARDLGLLRELGLELTQVLDTHVHADHVTGAGELRRLAGAKTHCARTGNVPCADVALDDGDLVLVGGLRIEVLATPGHTSNCLTYKLEGRIFTGDALLVRGCGRTDFQSGDAGTLFDSVHARLFSLPESTLVYPAHDYRGFTSSTIGEERAHNPRLGAGVTRDAFIAKMAALGLPPPAKLAEALPANMGCGDAPKAS